MKFSHRSFLILCVCVMFAPFIPRASAVIKVDLPVAKRFASADTVIIGKISAVDPDHRVVEVTTVRRLKDDASPQTFRMQFSPVIALIKSVAVGQPVVFLSGEDQASVHLADTWLRASPKPGSKPTIWSIYQVDDNSAGKTFPGATASLVRVIEDLKAGKSSLLDDFEGKVFTGGVKLIASLDVAKPAALLSIDINADGKPDLVVATPTGVRLFLAAADGFTDVTEKWGLKGVAASSIAGGSVKGDGKIDLLLDGVLYLNDGQKFTAAPQTIKLDANTRVLGSALADLTGSGKLDAGLFLADGRLLVFKNNGQPAAPWSRAVDRKLQIAADPVQAAAFGDFSDGGPGVMIVQENAITLFPTKTDASADFGRLTGDALAKIKGFAGGMKSAIATPLDLNGDHRPDLLITADGAGMVLVNRGFGAFLPDSDAGAELNTAVVKALPASLSAIRARSALSKGGNTPDDLLLLSDDGHLFLVSNPGDAK